MPLPIEPSLPALRNALSIGRTAVLVAPPGAGKTTMVPLALRGEAWLGGQRIVMLEPRRLAARAAAARMARTLGEAVGGTVGYRMRLDTRVGPSTRVEVVTEGILTRMLQDDLALPDIGLVIFDEFHERSLVADTGLALCLATMESLRDDLRLLVMSATLDHVAVAALLGDAPVIRSEGHAWPVRTEYAPPRARATSQHRQLATHVAAVVRNAIIAETGSMLVFLPGAAEIRRTGELLEDSMPADVAVHQLFGALPPDQQDAAIAPAGPAQRKVVLATSIAETSLTIEGVRVVIDSGLTRTPRFSPRTGMTRLETVRVSRASADQRRGRAGRVEPGVCIRCWSAAEDAGLISYNRPEILDADLAVLALDLACAGFPDPAELRWLDPPPGAAFSAARELLGLLGAVDVRGKITPHGEAISALGTHPRLGHMLLRARELGPGSLGVATSLVALLEERDVLRGAGSAPPSDLRLRLDAVTRDMDHAVLAGATVDDRLVQRVREVAREWRHRMGTQQAPATSSDAVDAGLLLAFAYPDRVARRRDAAGHFVLRNGRGAALPPGDPLAQAEWIVAAQIDDAGREGRITLAAAIDPVALIGQDAHQVVTRDEISWNDATRSVQARRRTMLGALTVRDSALPQPDAAEMASALIDGITRLGIGAIPWTPAAAALRQRLAFLHHHDAHWPDRSDATLLATIGEWLGPRLIGMRKLDDLRSIDLAQALTDQLDWQQRRQLDELAPERIEVPSGSRIAIDYSDPAAPALAVRLQEVFGLSATPMLLGGRVPITMQLLSPAYRPVQVTRDLASFWRSGYFDVRKDLRGRYPRHHWPEDPLTAAPVRGAKRRR